MNIFERVEMVKRSKDDRLPSLAVVPKKQNPNRKKKHCKSSVFIYRIMTYISSIFIKQKNERITQSSTYEPNLERIFALIGGKL